jgi:peptidoglycan/LPS O-acetylase OafA/YrhL
MSSHADKRVFVEDRSHTRVLTGLRGFAALWVVAFHVWGVAGYSPVLVPVAGWNVNLTPFFGTGWAGVQIFFVLSGFLLGLPFAQWQAGLREKPSLGRYLFRRIARVYPAYYVQLIILLGLAYFLGQPNPISNFESLWRHLLMLFVPLPVGTTPINGVWWTLPIEFMFYLALPLLAGLLAPRRWWILLAGMLVSMWLWRVATIISLGSEPVPVRVVMAYQLPGAMDSFGMGMLGAMLHVHEGAVSSWLTRYRDGLAAVSLTIVLCCIYWLQFKVMDYWNHSLIFYSWTAIYSFAVLLVLLAGVKGSPIVNRLFGNSVIVFAGVISYSAYLWHFPLLQWLVGTAKFSHLGTYRLLLLLLATVLSTILAASVSYALIERPFMRLRRQRDNGGRKN